MAENGALPGAETTYVLMGNMDDEGWKDLATVNVPSRTKRKTVIEKGLEAAGLDPEAYSAGEVKVRVLDEESARSTPVTPKRGPAVWEIG